MVPSESVAPNPRHRMFSRLLLAAGGLLLLIAAFLGISDNPPAIALMLLGLFSLILGILTFFARSGNLDLFRLLLYWAPWALCLMFALFVSLFAMDVFKEGSGLLPTLSALGMHLIPTGIILLVLAFSWHREWIGGIFFPLLGLFYIYWAWGRPFAGWVTLTLVAGPPILTGILFLLNWHYRRELRSGS